MAVDGTYKISGEAMGTVLEGTLELASSGSKLAGTARIGSQMIELKNGKADGDSFTADVTAPTPMGDVKFKMSGKVAGDKISGRLKTLMVNAKYEGSRIK
jgi:hypothetical protein